MTFQYRYVGFGSVFQAASGVRASAELPPSTLFENELVVDVGGVCWGVGGEERSILDHHFHRDRDQFPSAAAAVLHNAARIRARFEPYLTSGQRVWLVTHRVADFDAYCAMYLARGILTGQIPSSGWDAFGLSPDGWPSSPRKGQPWVNWFAPDLRVFSAEPTRRAAVTLAALAACVDNCQRLACPRTRSLNGVLYAGVARGRDFETNGAVELFDAATTAIIRRELNPLFDSVLDQSETFAPELAMLDRESEAYQRDIRRSRRATVNIQRTDQPFAAWFGGVRDRALMNAEGRLDADHLLNQHQRDQVDGIFLRDPECLMFKDWARIDAENSAEGEGFLFTAIAYSDRVSVDAVNRSRYIFSLDPERADRRHLYSVWARLERAEIDAIRGPEADAQRLRTSLETAELAALTKGGTACRSGFEARAGSLAALFDDPWFDGSNYACTIIDTPNRGTLIGPPGRRDDLTDDPVVRLVREELEFSWLVGEIAVNDFAAGTTEESSSSHVSPNLDLPAPLPRHFRVATVALRETVDVFRGTLAHEIGRSLWPLLDSSRGLGVPETFATQHLISHAHWLAVWNHRGLVVAYKSAGKPTGTRFTELVASMAQQATAVDRLVREDGSITDGTVERIDSLVRAVARLKHALTLPENAVPARLFEATRLDDVLATASSINLSAIQRLEEQRAKAVNARMSENIAVVANVQLLLEYVEVVLVSVYSAHLWHMFASENEPLHDWMTARSLWLGEWFVSLGVVGAAAIGGGAAIVAIGAWRKRHG